MADDGVRKAPVKRAQRSAIVAVVMVGAVSTAGTPLGAAYDADSENDDGRDL